VITLLTVTVTVPAGATTGTVSVYQQLATIDEVNETFTIAMELFGYWYNHDNDNAPYCGNDHSASATEGSVVFNFTLSNF
jgi:hypothetical protein